MRQIYDIFVYSGFNILPHEIMELTDGERNMIFTFLKIAKEDKKLPIVLGNFPTKER